MVTKRMATMEFECMVYWFMVYKFTIILRAMAMCGRARMGRSQLLLLYLWEGAFSYTCLLLVPGLEIDSGWVLIRKALGCNGIFGPIPGF
ncbi:hypothetical protein QBC38DRAFT_480297 [Podospora fimiseda]|uniref:Uncharacterized protein n=1 Tax=Podospora fimiseda TaxID=252190 RepID=A0AAN7GX86_9PEZI|nr:hypothetical protein QBC38DRAFT_480297 [Podospora fimiseda]